MPRNKKNKIIIVILAVLVIIEALVIIFLSLKLPKKQPAKEDIIAQIKPKIAIVLDDWGYNLHNLAVLDQIRQPLTMSVLPNLNYSQSVSLELQKRGFEVILHLPMEPREKYSLEENTIMIGMNPKSIREILGADLENVSCAKGISNHMGSKVTENLKVMTVVFKELKKRHLYFLDSYVSNHSVCFDLAKKINLKFARRDIFLDNQDEPAYIKNQIKKLKSRARLKGYAIGIGHDRKNTLEALREELPLLEKDGYKIVYLSELIK